MHLHVHSDIASYGVAMDQQYIYEDRPDELGKINNENEDKARLTYKSIPSILRPHNLLVCHSIFDLPRPAIK